MSQEPALTTVEQTAPPAWLTPSTKAFVSLAMAHTLIDCYSMPWSMFKTLAGLDLGRAGMIGAIVGEFISSNRGLGFMIIDSQSEWDIAGVFAAIFSIFLMVLCLNAVVSFMERKFLRWRPPEGGEIATGGE